MRHRRGDDEQVVDGLNTTLMTSAEPATLASEAVAALQRLTHRHARSGCAGGRQAGIRPRGGAPVVTSRCLAFTVLLVLAGCGGAARVVDLPTGNIYRDQDLGGEFPVVVLGNPFAAASRPPLTGRAVPASPAGFASD